MARQKPQRSREELVSKLGDQRRALDASAKAYDAGEEWEAERLATTAFTLLHDGGAIFSLLNQLGVKDKLKFVSSGRMSRPTGFPAPTIAFPALLIAKGGKFVPKLGGGPPTYFTMPFERWWKDEMIYEEASSGQFSRMRLVFALRHQDGGGHIGTLTDDIYVHLKKGAGWFLRRSDQTTEPVTNLIGASMRQVAWEVSETLKQLDDDLQ